MNGLSDEILMVKERQEREHLTNDEVIEEAMRSSYRKKQKRIEELRNN